MSEKDRRAREGFEEYPYELTGVLVHASSMNSGHYMAYVRASNGAWNLMDDSSVSQVGLNRVLRQKAYMLFYAKKVKRAPQMPRPAVANRSNGSAFPEERGEYAGARPVEGSALASAIQDRVRNPAALPDGSAPVFKTALFGNFLKKEEPEHDKKNGDEGYSADVQKRLEELKDQCDERIKYIDKVKKRCQAHFFLGKQDYPAFVRQLRNLLHRQCDMRRLYERAVAETIAEAKRNVAQTTPRLPEEGQTPRLPEISPIREAEPRRRSLKSFSRGDERVTIEAGTKRSASAGRARWLEQRRAQRVQERARARKRKKAQMEGSIATTSGMPSWIPEK